MSKKLLVGLGSLCLTPLLLELGFRALEGPLGIDEKGLENTRAYVCDGSFGWYAPHPYTSYIKPINKFGFNDLEFCASAFPAITTVATPRYEMGRRAAEIVLEIIRGSGDRPRERKIDLGFSIVERASTRRRPATVTSAPSKVARLLKPVP